MKNDLIWIIRSSHEYTEWNYLMIFLLKTRNYLDH